METQEVAFALAIVALFSGAVGFQLSRMLLKSRVWEMVREETERRIQDLTWENTMLKTTNKLLRGQIDRAVVDAKQALEERNAIAKLISKKLPNGK